jgi:LCP family protein required for cell wall assembly
LELTVVVTSTQQAPPPGLSPDRRARKRHRSLLQRLLFIVAGLLAVVVLLGSVGGFVVVKWFDGSIARVKLNLGQDRPAAAPIGSENWLLVGTDSRAGSSGEFGSGIIGARSDTTILTHLDADGTTTNISIPRDTLVTIPAYTLKGVNYPAHKDKFNAAIYDGGPSLLVRTVEKLFNVQVDHYVSVDLEGFKKISQVINGVQVCIKPAPASANEDGGLITNINDGFSGFHGRYGEQTLVGDQAVDFVRQRHGLPDSDLSRIQRQQQFLGSVFRTATRVNLLFNPVAVTRLLGAIQKALTLDEGTSLTDLEKLGLRLRGLDPSKVFFETLPQRGLDVTDTDLGTIDTSTPNVPTLTPTGQDVNVGSVQIIVQPQFDEMVAKIRDTGTSGSSSIGRSGGSVSASNAQAVAVTVDPSQVQVTVEDGVGKVGLASQVTTALAKDAFPTGVPGPAATTGYADSQVHYGTGNKAAAETVAAAVPGSVLVEDPGVTSGIVLVVGSNFTKVVPVSVSDIPTNNSPTPTPTATPSPNPSPISADSQDNRCTY